MHSITACRFRLLALVITSFLSACVWPSMALAQQNANTLLSHCSLLLQTSQANGGAISFSDAPEAAICWGFMQAMQDLSSISFDGGKRTVTGACLPSDSSASQLVRVFVNYAQSHPAQLHERPSLVVLRAFSSAFPCGRQ